MTQFYIERILRNLLSHMQKIELINDFSEAAGYMVYIQNQFISIFKHSISNEIKKSTYSMTKNI